MANMADVVIAVKDADFYVTTPSDVTADTCYEQGTVDILADDLDGALTAAKDVVEGRLCHPLRNRTGNRWRHHRRLCGL